VEEEAAEGKKEHVEEEEDKDKPGSRSQTPTRIQTKKSQPSGLKKFFDKWDFVLLPIVITHCNLVANTSYPWLP